MFKSIGNAVSGAARSIGGAVSSIGNTAGNILGSTLGAGIGMVTAPLQGLAQGLGGQVQQGGVPMQQGGGLGLAQAGQPVGAAVQAQSKQQMQQGSSFDAIANQQNQLIGGAALEIAMQDLVNRNRDTDAEWGDLLSIIDRKE